MNLIFSLEDSLTDGLPISPTAYAAFQGIIFDVISHFEYDTGRAWLDYDSHLLYARVQTSSDDVIIVTFNPDNFNLELSGMDPQQRKTLAGKLASLLRMDIQFDPIDMSFKFSWSALNQKKI